MLQHIAPPAASLPVALLDRLATWAECQPRCPALVHLADGDEEQERIDYGGLFERINAVAAWLRGHVAPGERVLLAPHSEVHYLVGLLACLRAEVVAVPTLSPLNARGLSRIRAHGEDAGACALLVDAWVLARRDRHHGDPDDWVHGIPWLNIADAYLPAVSPPSQTGLLPSPEDRAGRPAYLQYTSGSTSRPKGVMITHANLAAQLGGLERVLDHRPGSVICNWMPLYHDFGLIMSLQALYSGGTAVLLPAVVTVQRPRRWLRAISDYRAVSSAAPNFMFDRCVERIPQSDCLGLDLSSLRHVMNGGEPNQPATLGAFTEFFHPYGLDESACLPSYGLAEATLVVAMRMPGAGPLVGSFDPEGLLQFRAVAVSAAAQGKELVSCGTPLVEKSVSIVDPETGQLCPAGSIGEVWVASPSVAAGFWARDVESIDTFEARLSNQTNNRGHLRTGDLGFLWEGELFIAGRHKDLIIVRGENHYPQDIEYTAAQSHADLEPNAGAAFAIDGTHGELLVVVQEVRREAHKRIATAEVFAALRQAVAENHGLDPAHIILLRPGGLPRTSSGKVQRRACRQAWQGGQLPVLADWCASSAEQGVAERNADPLELEVLATCQQLLANRHIDPQISLFEYGVDSLKAVEILLALEVRWEVTLDLADFADNSSVALLAQMIRVYRDTPRSANPSQPFFLGDRAEGVSPDPDGLIAQLRHYVATWEGERHAPDRLLVGRNINGTKSPLFWVFQGQQEFTALADRLGPDQPVYAMRSGHQVMEYTEANIQTLATSYRREISAIHPHGPYLLGGNCQGGLIALAIAQQFWRIQKPVALLSLLEWAFPPQPYLGRVALFWGASSTQKNPYFKFRNPELYWHRAFGAFTTDIITGGHGEFFSGQNLEMLASRLADRLREATDVAPLFQPSSAFRAVYRPINPPTQLTVSQQFRIEVEIQNISAIDWEASEISGLQLGNHWLDNERQGVSWLDGVARLPAVSVGGKTTVSLPVRSPSKPGTYFLQLDLVEEGVAWFSERGVKAVALPITVSAMDGDAAKC